MQRLKKEFFQRSALEVARDILGKYLVREFSRGKAILKIVEAEAYLGKEDAASHSYRGKVTARNKVMYKEGGVFYIYKIYGMYYCLNVVANKKDIPEAVFIRAAEPLAGIKIMQMNRGLRAENLKSLSNGPGKLSQALKLDVGFYGRSVENKEFYFLKGEKVPFSDIVQAPRVNVDYAAEDKYLPYRFYIKDNRFVSRK